MDAGLGLYISIPFCRAKCTYCNFASGVFPATYMERYMERVCEDLQSAQEFVFAKSIQSIYLGGGTPSLLPSHLFRRLFAAIQERFEVCSEAEITIECAPGQLADETLETMVECGVNRISFGVQSFIDLEAKATGRLHTRGIALEDIRRVRQAGIRSVNVDLIAGLPHQTEASWQESLDVLLQTDVDHASIYMLEVDDDSRLGREVLNGGARYFAPAIPSDDAIAGMYASAIETLAANGLYQYEISNFARAGTESQHNKKYWLRKPYLGLGGDAHSMLRREDGKAVRFATTDDLESYLQSPGWNERHLLSRQEELEEAWFLGLRLNAGVDLNDMEAEFGTEAVESCGPVVDGLVSDGLLRREGDSVSLTIQGRLLSNDVFERFLGAEDVALHERTSMTPA
jgi:oxygen-independent coproporphyrinogen-3 oxidase